MIARDRAKEFMAAIAEELKTTATQGRHLRCNHGRCRHYRDKSWVAIAKSRAFVVLFWSKQHLFWNHRRNDCAHQYCLIRLIQASLKTLEDNALLVTQAVK